MGIPVADRTWVFLRGLARESAHWDGFPDYYAQAIHGARVCPVDLPGNGQHWRLPSPLSVRETMETVRQEALALMQAQRQGGNPFYLFTISLGSMLAVEWAHRYPDELAGAVLVNTSLRGLNPLHQRLSLHVWPLLARIAATMDIAQRERLALAMTSARQCSDDGLIQNRVNIHRRHPVQPKNLFRQLWAAARYHAPQEKPSIPLLILNSLGDRMVSPACTGAIAKFWNMEPKTHPWAGHDLTLDDPKWVIQEVGAWLEGQHLL